ncbi:UDP-N-acetylmuramoylalanine--D-glutamate ligase [Orientia chuto str. Dubai]|uniref:UDP-N-acetylmuramoylalanine--D-glutamate ligase n=1 Tax=Orientia chuto str. Dubai TaxID=1359168 RepID=A0A0F3MP70_9RICK|nr:UDP-N-acetylmuramoyl-L-alanine--D-glutamate ligase [Candidatus Orientia mediorientalis]KJV57247.1 UDP-N-acetylmuramoylalanine--D-glutamate ligase [Orientia chuto str. Dubai]
MIRLYSQRNKKIGVFGLSRTGLAVCKSLAGLADLIIYDDSHSIRDSFYQQNINLQDYKMISVDQLEWRTCDFIVLSPGIPYYTASHYIVKHAQKYKIPIKSDIDLLYNEYPNRKYIGVTGTNGKSTTSALIHHILTLTNGQFDLGGNIGKAVLSLRDDVEGYILELSSFQLDLITDLKLDIAVLLNITTDHMDRYHSFNQYVLSKKKIISLVTKNGYALINNECSIIFSANYNTFNKNGFRNYSPKLEKQVIHTNMDLQYHPKTGLQKEKILVKFPSCLPQKFTSLLLGKHNNQNIAAAFYTCNILGRNEYDIINAIKSFQPLPHRMQYIGKKNNIYIYNDSKATNIDAASKSLSSLSNIYWIAGGVAKKGGNIFLNEAILHAVKKAYLYGQSRYYLAEILKGQIIFSISNTMEEAFNQAIIDAESDKSGPNRKNILLAPACASFDQFKNYEDRGNQFIKISQAFLTN